MDVICKIGLGIKDCRQFDNKFTKMIKKMLHDIEDTFSYIRLVINFRCNRQKLTLNLLAGLFPISAVIYELFN